MIYPPIELAIVVFNPTCRMPGGFDIRPVAGRCVISHLVYVTKLHRSSIDARYTCLIVIEVI